MVIPHQANVMNIQVTPISIFAETFQKEREGRKWIQLKKFPQGINPVQEQQAVLPEILPFYTTLQITLQNIAYAKILYFVLICFQIYIVGET